MLYVFSNCPTCHVEFTTKQRPYTLPCGHVHCLKCLASRTLTPATSMSVCPCTGCHEPYTGRDLRSLQTPFTHDTPCTDPLHLPVPSHGIRPSPPNRSRSLERRRIEELESLLAKTEQENAELRTQLNKNVRSLHSMARQAQRLKEQIHHWWTCAQSKEEECTSLRQTLHKNIVRPASRIPAPPPRPLVPSNSPQKEDDRSVRYAKLSQFI